MLSVCVRVCAVGERHRETETERSSFHTTTEEDVIVPIEQPSRYSWRQPTNQPTTNRANNARCMPLRLIFYSLMISMQFLVYDAVRIALGVGSDDLKLYLDVLGGVLKDS